jgi:hypothetical protein
MSRRRFLKALGFSGAGMVGLSSYGLAVEPGYRLCVTRYQVRPPSWTPGLNLSVGVIADVRQQAADAGRAHPCHRQRTNELKRTTSCC